MSPPAPTPCLRAFHIHPAGKGAEALAPFRKRRRAAQARIQAVATDMPMPYIEAVRQQNPGSEAPSLPLPGPAVL
jgi:hypothetical protein